MTSLVAFMRPSFTRIRRWLHDGALPSSHPREPDPPIGLGVDPVPDPGHAPGHRHLSAPPSLPGPRTPVQVRQPRHQAWQRTGRRTDRRRGNERHRGEEQD